MDVIKNCYYEKLDNYYICCIPFIIYQFQFGVAMLIVILMFNSLIFNRRKHSQLLILLLIFILGSLVNYYYTYQKYIENKKIYTENIKKLEKYNGQDTIYIRKYIYDDSSFADIIGYGWIEDDIKKLYHIDKNVKFIEIK